MADDSNDFLETLKNSALYNLPVPDRNLPWNGGCASVLAFIAITVGIVYTLLG